MPEGYKVKLVAPDYAFKKMTVAVMRSDGEWGIPAERAKYTLIKRFPRYSEHYTGTAECDCLLVQAGDKGWALLVEGRTDAHPGLFALDGITLKYLEWDNVPEHIKDEVIFQCVEEVL
jgi:hypothetical protein